MASKLKVDQIEGQSGTSVEVPTGHTLKVADLGNNKILSTNSSGVVVATPMGSTDQVLKMTGTNTIGFGAGDGKLKQIVNGIWENGSSGWSTTSTSFVDTPLTFTITPTASTSKILVSFVTNGSWSSSTGVNAIYSINRAISGGATTDLGAGSTFGLAHTYNPNPAIQTLQKVDEPNTTSQITYTMIAKCDSGTCYVARANTQNTYYAIEIGV